MKNLLFCIVVLAFMACNEEPKIDYAIINGKIENSKAEKAVIKGLGMEHEISIDKTGAFSDTVSLSKNGFYNLRINRNQAALYLTKGSNLTITLDATKFNESISFTGGGAAENNYLAAKKLVNDVPREGMADFLSLDETAYKAKVNDFMETNKTALGKLEGADKYFIAQESKNLEYDTYSFLSTYGEGHAYFTKNDSFKVSDSFLPKAYLDLTYDDVDAYNSSDAYQQMAFGHFMGDIFKEEVDITALTPADLQDVAGIKIPALKDEVLGYLSKIALSPANPDLKSLYDFYVSNISDEKVKEELKTGYEKIKDLVKGKPSPSFVNYENHKGGETSLEDLKGKYVYVDVWATWCGPCKAEIPSLKKVEKEYHNKNISFVSTSIDVAKDHEKWVDMVKDKDLGGVQLMADNNWNSKFVSDYAIQGIPRFILIDPQGNIVSADAPRPSDPKLKELFDSLEM